jgi:sterol desaturase/sphingolipid hydroxylase (fatty acid hydroxylase superfamily)
MGIGSCTGQEPRMDLADPSTLLAFAAAALNSVAARFVDMVVSPGTFSLASLLSALCVATLFLGLKGRRRRPLKVLVRALFPLRLRRSPSSRIDIRYFVFNVFVVGLCFGWAVLSAQVLSNATDALLVSAFGARPAVLSAWPAACIMTLVLFVAYEFGYWIDHYLSHNVPFLWEFHKVHHTAEVLSPLTNFRVHPVDTIKFNNILALVMGPAGGIASYLLGRDAAPLTIANSNAIILLFFFLIGHLQHSHVWIAFTGVWGRLILSPAHHQIHHSTDPAHFNRNLGSFLAVFDWLFGTLQIPTRRRQKLDFGVEPKTAEAHTLIDGLVRSFGRAFAQLGFRRAASPPRAPRRA